MGWSERGQDTEKERRGVRGEKVGQDAGEREGVREGGCG